MTSMIVADLRRVWQYVNDATGVPMSSAMKCLGLERDGRLVAGVLYDGWNGVSLWAHVAIEPGAYLGRAFLWYIFHYPFREIGARKLIAWVEESNAASLRFTSGCGFEVEARLRAAGSDGGDVLLMSMHEGQSRWLRRAPSMAGLAELESRAHGKKVERCAGA